MAQTKMRMTAAIRPNLGMDFPDPDVIFVDGTYYMISTTMHFLPGGQILRSGDLLHWEHAAYVFDTLDGTDAQKLRNGKYIYGKGMWAASLRYHKGTFYVVFVCNDTQKTYLFRSEKIEGPWRKSEIEGFYHDCSLLFDDDDRIYVVYGNRSIYLTELNAELTGPKEGGLSRLLLKDSDETRLGFEGSHFYKINGRYYLFLIHSRKDRWRRVEACFSSDSLEGEFEGGDIFDDDMGFRDSGIAQGGIVQGVGGNWYAVMFQDSGAVGRLPVVVPVTFENRRPVFGIDGKAPKTLSLPISEKFPEGYEYAPLSSSDDFRYGFPWGTKKEDTSDPETFQRKYGTFGLSSVWQCNHEPDLNLLYRDEKTGTLWIATDILSLNINHCKNTMTQRMRYPGSAAEVTLDYSHLKDGDKMGLCAFQGDYAWVGVERRADRFFEVMVSHKSTEGIWDLSPVPGDIIEERELSPSSEKALRVRMEVDFSSEKDQASCLTKKGDSWESIGKPHKLCFRLDHFTGVRFGLFVYSTKETGGKGGFSRFEFE